MSAANEALGRLYFTEEDRLHGPPPELCNEDYVAHISGNPPLTFADHAALAAGFYSAFPDYVHVIDDVVANDRTVVVRFTLRGTHLGEFAGIPASGNPVEAVGISMLTVRDGKVSSVNGVFDQIAMLRQVGAFPAA
ncbi:ester cyclase [Sphingomonas sp. SRS2]|uniref:ester cyclase n=1 Tax=Sphingomonas sp. SRS2 TaxID=133190 RepID=UPI00069896A0|nr:ester cyclase [Sphingomonas sp. SRS2]